MKVGACAFGLRGSKLWLTNCGRRLQATNEGSVLPIQKLRVTVAINRFIDLPQDTRDGDFPSEHPYATAALAVTLIGAGMAALLPVVTVGLLAMIGLGPGGVAAG